MYCACIYVTQNNRAKTEQMARKINSNGGILIAAEKGESGNPNGRPKGAISFKAILSKVLDAEMTIEDAEGKRTITRYEAMLLKVAQDAATSADPAVRLRATQWLVDRREGKAPETINATVQSFTTPGALNVDELEQILRIAKIEPKSEE
jgi:hypothetical protein